MVEKTVILRPEMSDNPQDEDTTLVYTPSGTPAEEAHLLVAEIEADDDATFVTILNALYPFRVNFYPSKNMKYSKIKLHCRIRSDGETCAGQVGIRALPKEGSASEEVYVGMLKTAPGVSDWMDYIVDFSQETALLDAVNSNEYDRIQVQVSSGMGSTTGKTTGNAAIDADYTQIYLELAYLENDPLYLRYNDVWMAIEGTVYQKINGTWVDSSTDILQAEDTFKLVPI